MAGIWNGMSYQKQSSIRFERFVERSFYNCACWYYMQKKNLNFNCEDIQLRRVVNVKYLLFKINKNIKLQVRCFDENKIEFDQLDNFRCQFIRCLKYNSHFY